MLGRTLSWRQGKSTLKPVVSFSKAVVHGIYMLCYLNRQDAGSVVSATMLSKEVNVPPERARKILMRLCVSGLVTSVNGRSGGYAPSRSMEDTSVLDVLDAIGPVGDDHNLQPRVCAAAHDEACSVQPRLAGLREQMLRFLASKTLASVVGHECSESAETSLATVCDGCRDSVDEAVAAL